MATQTTADLVVALQRTEGKAEIVGGEIVLMSPAGGAAQQTAPAIST